jgi:hypothetical protein
LALLKFDLDDEFVICLLLFSDIENTLLSAYGVLEVVSRVNVFQNELSLAFKTANTRHTNSVTRKVKDVHVRYRSGVQDVRPYFSIVYKFYADRLLRDRKVHHRPFLRGETNKVLHDGVLKDIDRPAVKINVDFRMKAKCSAI